MTDRTMIRELTERLRKIIEDRKNNNMTFDMLINLVKTKNITDDNIHILVYTYYNHIYIDKKKLNSRSHLINNWDVSKVTNMSYIFWDLSLFNQELNDWDVGNVKNMQYMFSNCERFNRPLNDWDVSEVEKMSYMFQSCTKFNQPLNDWDVSEVERMDSMFEFCREFNQPLNDWKEKVSKVERMDSMFYYCEMFNQPLNDWEVSNVKRMDNMFYQCKKFNQPLNKWNVSNVEDMDSMFYKCKDFNQQLNSWNPISTINLDLEDMFDGCDSLDRQFLTTENWINLPVEEYEDEDHDDDEEIATEIHEAFNKHFQKNSKKYFEIIGSCPSVKEDNHYLLEPNLIEHVKNKIYSYIDEHYVQQEREPLKDQLKVIFERVKNTTYMTEADNRILIGKTVDFILYQPDDFIKFYLSAFVHDCYYAYSQGEGLERMSCTKGILERFYFLIGDSAFAVCPDNTCDNEIYDKKIYEDLQILFNKRIDRDEFNSFSGEWANIHLQSEEVHNLSEEDRKKHYISFMIAKYNETGRDDDMTIEEIKREADKFENINVFKDLVFGGGKKKQLKKRRTIKKNKKQKTKKSTFGKRKTKTRRNNRKSVRHIKK